MSLRSRHLALQKAARLFDLALVTMSFFAAFAVSSGSFTWPSLAEVLVVRIKVVNFLLFAGYLGICSAIFSSCGFYLSHRLSGWERRAREIILAVTLITGVLPLLQLALATNAFLLCFWLFTVVSLILSRLCGHAAGSIARSRGRNLRNIVVIGEGRNANVLAERIEKETGLGYRVVRIINADEV